MTYNAAASQLCVEVLVKASDTLVPAVVGQHMVEALIKASDSLAPADVAQFAVEVLIKAADSAVPAKVTQHVLQVLIKAADSLSPTKTSQLVLQFLVWSGFVTYPVFPTLQGLGFSVIKRPVFYNAQAKSGSGYTVRVGYAQTPTWEWDLLWDYLPDNGTPSDLKNLMGFFLAMQGSLTPFCYQDPDDYTQLGIEIGTGNGSSTQFTLVRGTNPGSSNQGIENIGILNTAATFNVYLNSVLQSPSSYTVNTGLPYQQSITFASAPANGLIVSVDMSWYYWVHFKDDQYDFEKFLYQLWQQNKITLESLKG
jgi:uncharacterized protein (TIGR02217 family)